MQAYSNLTIEMNIPAHTCRLKSLVAQVTRLCWIGKRTGNLPLDSPMTNHLMQTYRQFRTLLWFAAVPFILPTGNPRAFGQGANDTPSKSSAPTSIAKFASTPILPNSSSPKGSIPTIEIGPTKAKVTPLETALGKVPTILQNVRPMEVALDFLVLSSLTSRKTFASFNGGVTIDATTILDYEISEQLRQFALSQFDPNVTAFLIGNDINKPNKSFFGPGLTQQNKIDETEFNARLSKTWQNGLISSIGYEPSLAYLFFPQGNGSGFNPTYSSDIVLRLEQPLMRGRGKDVNLVNVRIAERRAMQSQFEIEAALQSQLRSIEQVYWRLHAEHVRLKAIDGAIVLAQKIVSVVEARLDAERVIYADVARARVKLEDLFQQRLAAELAIRTASFDLAQLAGLELDETFLLVPVEEPERRAPEFDSHLIVNSAITFNPKLRRQRQEIEVRRQNVIGSKNQLLPKMNLQASHRTSGLDDDLSHSLDQMLSYRFSDYSLGIQYTQQIGMRQAKSQFEAAKLQSARELALLESLERKVGFDVLQSLNELKLIFERYTSALRQVEQSKKWVEIARTRYEDPPLSISNKESLLVLLTDFQTALQSQIDSLVLVARSLADYNSAIATVDERRGALLTKWRIGAMSVDGDVEQMKLVDTKFGQGENAQQSLPSPSAPVPAPTTSQPPIAPPRQNATPEVSVAPRVSGPSTVSSPLTVAAPLITPSPFAERPPIEINPTGIPALPAFPNRSIQEDSKRSTTIQLFIPPLPNGSR